VTSAAAGKAKSELRASEAARRLMGMCMAISARIMLKSKLNGDYKVGVNF
jgi:hypothetical protein